MSERDDADMSGGPRTEEARALLQKIFPMTRHLNDTRAVQTIAEAFDAIRTERDRLAGELVNARAVHFEFESVNRGRREELEEENASLRSARNAVIEECAGVRAIEGLSNPIIRDFIKESIRALRKEASGGKAE